MTMLFTAGILSLQTASGAQPGQTPDPVKVKAELKKILSSSEFQISKPEENALTRAWKWMSTHWEAFWKWMKDIFRTIFSSNIFGGGSAGIQWILIILFLILGIYIAVRLFLNLRASRLRLEESKSKTFSFVNEQEESFEDPDTLMASADEIADSGRFREALHALYMATLLRLNRKGLVEYQKFRTNGEYVQRLNHTDSSLLFNPFSALTDLFEMNWYGQHITTKETYEISRHQAKTIENMIDDAPPSAIKIKVMRTLPLNSSAEKDLQ